ncbi:MAG: hypothetical protein GYA51_00340 [Candidatus Methanofastidiosa archaeon]|nr:hypothetical protein [Candidatus Methanofastidiosa archaeon]
MMKCPRCGHDLSSNFCSNCGLYRLEFDGISCPICGAENNIDSTNCARCGIPLLRYNEYYPENYRVIGESIKKRELDSPSRSIIKGIVSLMIGVMLFLAIFYFIGLAYNPMSQLLPKPPESYNALITTNISNTGGDIFETQIWMALPANCDTQRNVSIKSITPEPDLITYDSDACTRICYWKFDNKFARDSTITIVQNVSFTAYPFAKSIDINKIEPYDYDSEIYKEYTKPSNKIESDDPEISKLAKDIVGNETNPYKKAALIYDFVIRHITYEKQKHELGAKYAYYTGKGDCTEFATLFAAMCRSEGIPVRLVEGYLCDSDTRAGHIWTELYIPPYGWIPADPTGDDKTNARFFFGRLGTNVLILSKGNVKIEPDYPDEKPYAFSYLAYYKTVDSGRLNFDTSADISRIE